MDHATLDHMADVLEATGRFRVFRHIPETPPLQIAREDDVLFRGAVLDTETTGVDIEVDEPIELAIVTFDYVGKSGNIVRIADTYSGLQEPTRALGPDVQRITGLTDNDLEGHQVDEARVAEILGSTSLIIAHNAAFDRRILERRWPKLPLRPWACSMTAIDWTAHGAPGRRLSDVLQMHGLFHSGHRALADCRGLLHALALPLPGSQQTALSALLINARASTVLIVADSAPFSASSILRGRGYKWHPAAPRAWWRECPIDSARDEIEYLEAHVYMCSTHEPSVTVVKAVDRFRPLGDFADRLVPASTFDLFR